MCKWKTYLFIYEDGKRIEQSFKSRSSFMAYLQKAWQQNLDYYEEI